MLICDYILKTVNRLEGGNHHRYYQNRLLHLSSLLYVIRQGGSNSVDLNTYLDLCLYHRPKLESLEPWFRCPQQPCPFAASCYLPLFEMLRQRAGSGSAQALFRLSSVTLTLGSGMLILSSG